MPHLPPAGCSTSKSGYSLPLLLVPPTGKWAESCPHTTPYSYACLTKWPPLPRLSLQPGVHCVSCSLPLPRVNGGLCRLQRALGHRGDNPHPRKPHPLCFYGSHAHLCGGKCPSRLNTSNLASCWEGRGGEGGEGGEGALVVSTTAI